MLEEYTRRHRDLAMVATEGTRFIREPPHVGYHEFPKDDHPWDSSLNQTRQARRDLIQRTSWETVKEFPSARTAIIAALSVQTSIGHAQSEASYRKRS